MVVASLNEGGKESRFELRPNQSLSRRGMILFYLAISIVAMSISTAFYMVGLWMVLPFAGFEVLVLGAAFFWIARNSHCREFVFIGPDYVRVEKGRKVREETIEFQRGWAQVVLEPSSIRWYPSRLLLRSHGEETEIGLFLNEQERSQLAKQLRQALNDGR